MIHIRTIFNVCEYIAFSHFRNQVFLTCCFQEAESTPSVQYQKFVLGIAYHMQKTDFELDVPCPRKVQKTWVCVQIS